MRFLALERTDGHRLLLAGRHWRVLNVDWRRRVVQLEPAPGQGKARWTGEGRALSFEACQGMRRALAGEALDGVTLSRRAETQLDAARVQFS